MENRAEYEIQYKTLFQRVIGIISKGGLKELLIRTINAVKYKFLIIFSPIIIFFKPKGFFSLPSWIMPLKMNGRRKEKVNITAITYTTNI